MPVGEIKLTGMNVAEVAAMIQFAEVPRHLLLAVPELRPLLRAAEREGEVVRAHFPEAFAVLDTLLTGIFFDSPTVRRPLTLPTEYTLTEESVFFAYGLRHDRGRLVARFESRPQAAPTVKRLWFPGESTPQNLLTRPWIQVVEPASVILDIDGVICDSREAIRLELEYALNVTLADGGPYDTWGFTHEDPGVLDFIRKFGLQAWRAVTIRGEGKAIPGSAEVAQTLSKRGLLAGYVTRRSADLREHTCEWLALNGFPHPDRLRFVTSPCKTDACKALGGPAVTLVEDSPTEALGAARRGLSVALVAAPYNAGLREQIELGLPGESADTYLNIQVIARLEELR